MKFIKSLFFLDFVGWIEKDGDTGYTNTSEAVYIGDHLDNNTIINSYNCNEFICKDSSLVSIPDANCSSKSSFFSFINYINKYRLFR
jgi:hypothetical protein